MVFDSGILVIFSGFSDGLIVANEVAVKRSSGPQKQLPVLKAGFYVKSHLLEGRHKQKIFVEGFFCMFEHV